MPDTTLATLEQIRIKIRRLTRSPSDSQLSTGQIDDYINTFVLYDFPEHLRQFSLYTTVRFYTQPYQDTYPTSSSLAEFGNVSTNPLYNFSNIYTTVHPPVYIAGRQAFYTQSRQEFFNQYPMINSIIDTGVTGDGATLTFSGVINPPGGLNSSARTSLLQSQVVITSQDANNNGISKVDKPLVSTQYGNKLSVGNLYEPGSVPVDPDTVVDATNTINYVTGAFTVTFATPPASGQPIRAKAVAVQTTLPQAVLYFNNSFIVRPVPDQVYPIQIEAYKRPTEFLSTNPSQLPQLAQWWQYIAYGASKKVFEDRNDIESVGLIMPEYKQQELLVLRATIVQQTEERVATIYTDYQGQYGPGWHSGGGQF